MSTNGGRPQGTWVVFFTLGATFLILGATTNLAFFGVGITFLVMGLVGIARSRLKDKGGDDGG